MLEASLGKGWDSRKQLGWRTAAVYREVVVGSARRVNDLKRAVMLRTEYGGLIYIPNQVPDICRHQLPWRYTPKNNLYCSDLSNGGVHVRSPRINRVYRHR